MMARLSTEEFQRIKNNEYDICCIKGKCKMSDGDIVKRLCSEIEAQQQEIEELRQENERLQETIEKVFEMATEAIKEIDETNQSVSDASEQTENTDYGFGHDFSYPVIERRVEKDGK